MNYSKGIHHEIGDDSLSRPLIKTEKEPITN